MKRYTKKDIEIFKRVIIDYELIKKDIDARIKKGYTFSDLFDYIDNLSACNITNYKFSNDIEVYENEYVDFNYCDMCITLYNDNCDLYLGDTIEVWDDKNNIYIDYFNCVNELKAIVKGCEENGK